MPRAPTSHSNVCVLKCRFYCYPGKVRPADQEATAVEKIVSVPKRRGPSLGDPPEKPQGLSGGRGGQRASPVVSAGENRQDRAKGFPLAHLNNFKGPWGTEAMPSNLVPGPGMIRAGG